MNINPYLEVFLGDDESVKIAGSLYNVSGNIVHSIYEKSSRVSVTFMLMHAYMGLDEALRIYNATLNGIMEDSRKYKSISVFDKYTNESYQTLSFLVMLGKETEICTELVDELTHFRDVKPFASNLKPKYLQGI